MKGDEKLTNYPRFSGCGAKLGPGVLEKALCGLEQPAYEGMIADFANCEDAGLFAMGAAGRSSRPSTSSRPSSTRASSSGA